MYSDLHIVKLTHLEIGEHSSFFNYFFQNLEITKLSRLIIPLKQIRFCININKT